MTNRNGGVPEGVPHEVLELGGHEFVAVYTMGTALRLRRELAKLGVDVNDPEAVARADDAEVGFLTLWAMIAHGDHADLTPEEFADMIPADDQLAAVMGRAERIKVESGQVKPVGGPRTRRTTGKKKGRAKKS